MELDARQTLILAVLVLFLGRFLGKKIAFLQKYNIPEPVTGGIIASICFSLIYLLFDKTINFSLHQRDVLLVIFFTCVGLSAKFSTLKQGGKSLAILLALAVCFLFIQNLTGVLTAKVTQLPEFLGMLSGSISLSGGHGTAIAWAPVFSEKLGVSNSMEIGVACATFGLILGGLCGGPVANYLINRHNLSSSSQEHLVVGTNDEEEKITVHSVYNALLVLGISVGIGIHLHDVISHYGINLPIFVTCLFGGIILTNTVPFISKKLSWPAGTPTLALISDFSLGLFLAMSLMSLQLWTLIDLALPILLILIAQVSVVVLFSIFVVFRLLGKTYDAAIITSGYTGLTLGATPTAIANMTAVTKKYGSSPLAFIVVPLIGAFFIDISNAFIIQFFISWLS